MRKRCSWIDDHKAWTTAEDDFLRAGRGTMTNKAMAVALPGRTPDAVSCRCRNLGLYKRDLRPPAPVAPLSKRFWVFSEVTVLRRHARSGPAYIRDRHLPHRTENAIGMMIKRLGLRGPRAGDLQVAA